MVEMFVVSALLITGSFLSSAKADESVAKATKNLPPNAYYCYLKALNVRRQAALTNLTPPPAPPDTKRTSRQDQKPYKKNAAEIKADAEALEIIRKGFSFTYKKPNNNETQDFSSSMSPFIDMFLNESDAKAKKGDWRGAASCALDAVRLAQDMTHGAILDVLLGNINLSMARKQLKQVLENGDISTIRMVINRLEKIFARQVQYGDVLEAEKQIGLLTFEELAANPNWWEENHITSIKNLQEFKEEYQSTMDKLVANARLPYPQREKSIPVPDNSVNQVELGLFSNPKYLNSGLTQGMPLANQQTKSTFLLVEFALRAYQLEHHQYPQTLEELVPNYLQKIPDDPFAANRPLRYINNKEACVLYSIGPDGIDDGGKQIDNKRLYADSKGDIVSEVQNW